MNFNLQPTLNSDLIKIVPLKEKDFDALFEVASDPLVWEQHPNKNRYQLEVFRNFFEGALASKGAFIIYENQHHKVIGSSRFYELNEENSAVTIGYTFISRSYWGKGYNQALKTLMFDYAFNYIDKIILHIGDTNFRSQKAIEKLDAKKMREVEVAYYGEPVKKNFEYQVDKVDWKKGERNIKTT